MEFISPTGELFATCNDGKNIIKVTGDYYALIDGKSIISRYGDYIGEIVRDSVSCRLCVISGYGGFLFSIQQK